MNFKTIKFWNALKPYGIVYSIHDWTIVKRLKNKLLNFKTSNAENF